jgi:hypothetical protein
MQQFVRAAFVQSDTLSMKRYGKYIRVQGEIACAGRLVVTVNKLLELTDSQSDTVQTLQYSYHLAVRGQHSVFRYDNAHPEFLFSGHRDEHHKHLFDWKTGDPLPSSPEWIGAARWPTLGEVLDEARQWYHQHYHELDAPHEFVPHAELRSAIQND